MMATGRRLGALLLAAVAVLVLVMTASSAGALEDSAKAIKVVGSGTYPEQNVEAYGRELADADKLDGRGGAIAILDTGVDDNHPTFKNAFVAGAEYDAVCGCMRDTQANGEPLNPDDSSGHGTHVASIALGRGTDDGPRGVAPGAALVDVKISDDLSVSTDPIEEGVDWVLKYNRGESNWTANPIEVKVIVLSFATLDTKDERDRDAAMESVKKARENGITVVVAAGNCGPDSGDVSMSCHDGGNDRDRVASPGAAPEALTVGAVDDNNSPRRGEDHVAGYSSRGPNPADNSSDKKWRKPDVVAPGSNITAACPEGIGDWSMSCEKSGTSMATPHVGGLAMIVHQALAEASETDATPAAVERMITSTASDLGDEGWDPVSGYGYVDGYEAVLEATNDPPDSKFTVRPPDPTAGEQVTLDAAESSDPDESDRIDRYVWKIGEDRTEKLDGDQTTLDVVFNETGSVTIELTTVDTRGAEDPEPHRDTITVSEPEPEETEDENQAPDVEVAYGPTPVRIERSTWFDAANSSDPDGDEIIGYAWDFEHNGTFEPDRRTEAPQASWTFAETGEHVVVLQATDGQAKARTNLTIDVQRPDHDPPDVEITNPQEGDVVASGTTNVTWSQAGGPADVFGVSIAADGQDPVAVDQTQAYYLEVHLSEDDRTIVLTAQGPGGESVDRVNVSVVDDESLDRSSTDEDGDEAEPNPPRPSASPGDDATAGDEPRSDENEDASNASGDDGETGANETPGPGLALAATLLTITGWATSRRR